MQLITLNCRNVFEMFNLITKPNYMFDAFIQDDQDAECARVRSL